MLEALTAGIAVFFTCTMFFTREKLLAWPAAIFWSIFGAIEFKTCITRDWTDTNYILFFAGSVAMTIFCIVAQFALREVDNRKTDEDEYVDEAADPDKETYYDEEEETSDSPFWDEAVDEDGTFIAEKRSSSRQTGRRARELQRRANHRRNRIHAN